MARKAASKAGEPDASMRLVVLYGKEYFLRAERTRALKDALEREYGKFDVFTFDGASARPAEVLDECRTFGLMAPHKLVIVDNADKLLAGSEDEEGGGKRAGGRAAFERYAAAPSEAATLLLRADKWNKGKLDDLVAKSGGAVIACEPLKHASEAVGRAVVMAKERHGVAMDRGSAEALVERVGVDLSRLDMEIAKLAAAAGGGAITRPLIAELAGEASDEAAWAIQSVLLSGDAAAILERLRASLEIARHPAPMVFWATIDIARKLHAASRALREGANEWSLAGPLKLWGESKDAVLGAAKRIDPARAAELLEAAVDADARSKSGLGSAERALEVLAVRFSEALAR